MSFLFLLSVFFMCRRGAGEPCMGGRKLTSPIMEGSLSVPQSTLINASQLPWLALLVPELGRGGGVGVVRIAAHDSPLACARALAGIADCK